MKILHIGKAGNMERFSPREIAVNMPAYTDLPMGLTAQEYIAAAPDAEVIVADAVAEISGELIRGLKSLKLIHSEGVAFNRIDTAAAKACCVKVCNCQGMNASAVAEQALLLMVGMLRNVAVNDRAVREARQITAKEAYMVSGTLRELPDCAVGLVGFGDIARATARLLRAYGVEEIYYYKRTPLTESEELDHGVRYLPLKDLLAVSDIVSLHLPVTPDTVNTADDGFFAAMKQGAMLVNTARGELVDDEALIRALTSGQLSMAGLDTLSHEPVQADHPLLQLPEETASRILFSPHIGGITASSFRRGYAMIWEAIRAVESGFEPAHCVNP